MNRIKLIRTFLILALLGPISPKLVRGDELHPFRPTWLPNFSLGSEANPLPWDPISEEGLNKCLTISGILVVDAWNKNLISGPTAQDTLKIARLNVLQALYPPPKNEFQLQKNLQGAEKSAKSLACLWGGVRIFLSSQCF